MEKPTVLTSEIVFHGFFNVQQDLLQRADGNKLPYIHFVLPTDAVVILAQTLEGAFVLNREYRHATGKVLLGLPGGTLHLNEDPLIGARRELFEESGYASDQMILLGAAYPLPALCNQKIYYVWAPNAFFKGPPERDPFEFIQTELKTEKEIQAEVVKGTILDGLLLTALSLKRISAL